MPVNYLCPLLLEQPIQEPPPTQTTKYCSCCSSPLTGDSLNPIVFLDDHDSNIVCGACRARLDSARADDSPSIYVDHGLSIGRPGLPSINASSRALSTTPSSEALFEDDIDLSTSPTSTVNSSVSSSIPSIRRPTSFLPSIAPRQLPVLSIRTPSSTSNTHHARSSPVRTESDYDREPSPDPSIDITRLRVRSQSCHCLYPGATFNGTQKSGRNSYDVTVTIVDVDLSSSFLCGYLCIRGLTEDWPELTTYFDAEIIGSRYGFLTQKWGASEEEDMLHWRRFPAFRHVGNELRRPCLTIPDRDRGAVFMRWKERFLVPDHKVHDINGASFAGFYYVCVEFSPSSSACNRRSSAIPECGHTAMPASPAQAKVSPRSHRGDSSVRGGGRCSSIGPRSAPPTATMSGFYYHQNSEPYQQLSLNHVPDRWSSSFEFR